jgi:sec-independent protein translocase protein TatA
MGLGMPEVVLILVIALIVFGPRKLPELGKSLGQAMSQFRRASEDFKRTWEQEVDLEKTKSSGTTAPAALGSASPETSGYSSDYYSYGYETEYGHESGHGEAPTSATPVTTSPTSGTGSTSSETVTNNSTGEKAANESTTPPVPEKKPWI